MKPVMCRRLRVGVIGLGIGKEHLAAYAALPELYEIAAIADFDAGRRKEIGDRFGVGARLADADALLRAEDLDIVDICTPPDTHFDLIARGLAAGLNVVCEKPLVGSLADCDRLAALEATSRGRIVPVFQYRFGNGLQKLKRLRELGLTGEAFLTTIETSWLRGADYYAVPWRGKWATEMGGVCVTQAIHAHDMLCYINGPIASVMARLRTRVNDIEAEDCAAVAVEMADGSLATLSATLGSAVQISRLRFCFRNLVAESALEPYRPSQDPWVFTGIDSRQQALIDAALADFTPGLEFFPGQFERMHAALATGAEPPVTLADARRSLELITAIYHSGLTGERVALPLTSAHPLHADWRAAPGAFR